MRRLSSTWPPRGRSDCAVRCQLDARHDDARKNLLIAGIALHGVYPSNFARLLVARVNSEYLSALIPLLGSRSLDECARGSTETVFQS